MRDSHRAFSRILKSRIIETLFLEKLVDRLLKVVIV